MTTDMQATIIELKSDLQDWIEEGHTENDANDYIFELADGGVPVYNSDILSWALENMSLAIDEPELGPAFDGSPTPINIIVANIFEMLQQELYEYYEEHKNDYDEEDEAEEDE